MDERDPLVDVLQPAAQHILEEAPRRLLIAHTEHDVIEAERCEHHRASTSYSRRSTGSGFCPSRRNVTRNPTASASAIVAARPMSSGAGSNDHGASRTQ